MIKRNKFKSKKKTKFKILKIIIFLIIVYFSFALTFKLIFENKIKNNDQLINYLLASSTNDIIANDDALKELLNYNWIDPSTLFKLSFNNLYDSFDTNYVYSEQEHDLESEVTTDYVEDPNPEEVEEPLIYIYNTHQRENYNTNNNQTHTIAPNVMMTSYKLREELNNLGHPSVVEVNDITEILRVNNWNYAYSYEASKMLIQDALNKNPSINYVIDIHRDSISYELSTAEVDGKKYAKILFLVGKEHPNYHKNLEFATKLDNILKSIMPGISRGIMIKGGEGVNGIYNQNLKENAILIEVGAQYNYIEEVNNSVLVLAQVLDKYIKGE